MNDREISGEIGSRADGEAGFTLLEMVISIVLLTMIIGAVSAAFVSSINATSATRQRVSSSDDAQLIAGFLTKDAQAAGGVVPTTGLKDPTLGVTAGAFAVGCTSSPPGTPILGLKWIDRTSGTTYVSNYSYVSGVSSPYVPQELLRTICISTSAVPPVTQMATSVLANNVVTTATASLALPTAWCDGNRPPANPPCPTTFPDSVSLGVSVSNATQNLTPPFSFVLTASLRPQHDAQPDLGASASSANLLLLGANGLCPVGAPPSIFAQSASFHITIYGSAGISGCATDLKKPADPFGPVFVSAPGNCNDFPASPPCTVVSNAFTDPFLARINSSPPTLSAPVANCSGVAPAVGADGHWQPGTYPTDPQAGGTVHAFDPGIYVFCNGLSKDVTANLQGGAIGGTFFYFKGGAFTPGDVQLTPPTDPTSQYNGIALWQPAANSAEMFFTKSLINITGTVYAPSASIGMKNGSVNINQLIAYAIDGTPGNPDVHIGPPLRATVIDPLPVGVVGQTYAGAQAQAVDGTGVYSGWTISGVTGMTISSTGVIGFTGGKPGAGVAPGTYTATIGVSDSDGEHATVTTHITIDAALTISTAALPASWTVNVPISPVAVTASGGSGSGYVWTPVQIAPGLQMSATGTITGTPTAIGTYNPTITVTDSFGDVASISPTVQITAPPLNPTTLLVGNGGTTAGKAEQNDTVTVAWSQAVSLSTVCSSWTTASQTVTGVTVTMGKGNGSNTNDLSLSLGSVGATACTGGVKIGTFVSSTNGYNTTNATKTFTSSTVSWVAATNKLVITLGTCGAGCPTGTVPLSTYTYAPVATITAAAYPSVTATGTATTGNVKNF